MNSEMHRYELEEITMSAAQKEILATARCTYATSMILTAFSRVPDAGRRAVAIVNSYKYMTVDASLSVLSFPEVLRKKVTPIVGVDV